MKKNNHGTARITEMQRAILQQGWSDLITVEVVHRASYPNGTEEAARSAIRRLCDDSYIESDNLDGQRVYYRLTAKGAKAIGLRKAPPPLKRQGKLKRYAVSWFIHADQPGKRALADAANLSGEFGLHGQSLPRHPFFIDDTIDRTRLGIILVDHNARMGRLVNKTLKPLRRFLRHGWFSEIIEAESFVVAILTFSARRKRVIDRFLPQHLAKQGDDLFRRVGPQSRPRFPLDLQVHVVPGLEPLVMLPHNETDE